MSSDASATFNGVEILIPGRGPFSRQGESPTADWITVNIDPQHALHTSDFLPWQGVHGKPWTGRVEVQEGVLTVPTGASRWGEFSFFAGKDEVDAIGTAGQEGVLILQDGTGNNITNNMVLLPPRPISQFLNVAPSQFSNDWMEPLYLVTLADRRVTWQGKRFAFPNDVQPVKTAADVLAAISAALGEALPTGSYDSDMLVVPKITDGRLKTVTRLLDGVCQSLGLRCVWTGAGAVLMDAGTCVARANVNNALSVPNNNRYTGGNLRYLAPVDTNAADINFLPSAVDVWFPRVEDGNVRGEPGYLKFIPLGGGNGHTYTLQTMEQAIWTSTGCPPTVPTDPDNKDRLDALAAEYATSWFAFQSGGLERIDSGITPYIADGLHRLEFAYRHDAITSRIVRETYDVDFDYQDMTGDESVKRRSIYRLKVGALVKTKQTTTLMAASVNNVPVNCNSTELSITPNAGGSTVTGIAAADLVSDLDGDRLLVVNNDSTSDAVTLAHLDAASTAAYRIYLPRAQPTLKLKPKESVWLEYDGTNKWWLVLLFCCTKPGKIVKTRETVSTGSNMNNYSLGQDTSLLDVTPSANISLSGMSGGEDGRMVEITNSDTSHTVTITNHSGSSSAGNQFQTSTGGSYAVPPGETTTAVYQSSTGYWIVESSSSQGGTGGSITVQLCDGSSSTAGITTLQFGTSQFTLTPSGSADCVTISGLSGSVINSGTVNYNYLGSGGTGGGGKVLTDTNTFVDPNSIDGGSRSMTSTGSTTPGFTTIFDGGGRVGIVNLKNTDAVNALSYQVIYTDFDSNTTTAPAGNLLAGQSVRIDCNVTAAGGGTTPPYPSILIQVKDGAGGATPWSLRRVLA